MSEQLLVNIDTIIEYLWRMPGVVKVDVEASHSDEDAYEKKVWVTFAGCKEEVVIELY